MMVGRSLSSYVLAIVCLHMIALPLISALPGMTDVWGPWTACTLPCDTGEQLRNHYCHDLNGDICGTDIQECSIKSCVDEFDGIDWTACSEECGSNGKRSRSNFAGHAQEISCNTFACPTQHRNCSSDIIFVLDSSHDIGEQNWFILKQWTMDVIRGLSDDIPSKTRISVIRFSNEVSVDLSLDNDLSTNDLLDVIWGLPWMAGNRNTADALKATREEFMRNGRWSKSRLAVIVTGGVSNVNEKETKKQSDFLSWIMERTVIGISNQPISDELRIIASNVGTAHEFNNFHELQQITNDIGMEVCAESSDSDICARCDYIKGQIWAVHENCHQFYVCEKISDDEYRKHEMTCGQLFWDQYVHTCVAHPPNGDPNCGVIVPYHQKNVTHGPCPYEPVMGHAQSFQSQGTPTDVQHCADGFEFMVEPCTCILISPQLVTASCKNGLVLSFPFDDDLNDHSCHKAISTPYGELMLDEVDGRKAVYFTGSGFLDVDFMRAWWSGSNVNAFSIGLWFKREHYISGTIASLLNNYGCRASATFGILTTEGGLLSGIKTLNNHFVFPSTEIMNNTWYHVGYVYTGYELKLYLNGIEIRSQSGITGAMFDVDVAVHIGFHNGLYFNGWFDEIRIWIRALNAKEIMEQYNEFP